MTIGTTRFFQNNSELFSRLNEDLKSLQSQAGSGKADLKLSENFRDVAKLSAADEMRSQMQHRARRWRKVHVCDVCADAHLQLCGCLQCIHI